MLGLWNFTISKMLLLLWCCLAWYPGIFCGDLDGWGMEISLVKEMSEIVFPLSSSWLTDVRLSFVSGCTHLNTSFPSPCLAKLRTNSRSGKHFWSIGNLYRWTSQNALKLQTKDCFVYFILPLFGSVFVCLFFFFVCLCLLFWVCWFVGD